MIYGHGDDIHQVKVPLKANFSSNVYYTGPDPRLLDFVRMNLDAVAHYPEPNADTLRQQLAEFHSLRANNMLVTNGTAEAIYLICQAFRGSDATIFIPTFSEYEDACVLNHIERTFIPAEKLDMGLRVHTRLAFLCNPNNPTGSFHEIEKIESLLAENSKTIFIIDEAYLAFAKKPESALVLLHKYQNIIILKSLTKTFSVPGLRIGYMVATHPVISQILQCKIPWSVSTPALFAGQYVIENYIDLLPHFQNLLHETTVLRKAINELPGYRAIPTSTHFFLVRLEKGTAYDLKKYLLEEHGCLIRNASNFRGLSAQYVRVATQSADDNQLLINGLTKWSQSFIS